MKWLAVSRVPVTARTFFDDMLVAQHEGNVSVLDAESIVENFEVLAERLLVVTTAHVNLKHLTTILYRHRLLQVKISKRKVK